MQCLSFSRIRYTYVSMHFLIKSDKATKSFQEKPIRNHSTQHNTSYKKRSNLQCPQVCATCCGFKKLKMEKSFVVLTVLIGVCCVIYQTESAPSPGVCANMCVHVHMHVCVCVCEVALPSGQGINLVITRLQVQLPVEQQNLFTLLQPIQLTWWPGVIWGSSQPSCVINVYRLARPSKHILKCCPCLANGCVTLTALPHHHPGAYPSADYQLSPRRICQHGSQYTGTPIFYHHLTVIRDFAYV